MVVSATDAILGWAGTELTAGLAARLGLAPEAVRAVNDVHAHALGEAWTGAAAGTASSLLVAFGTGVGGSFVLGGQPVLGHRYVGGHVGHFASPYAFPRAAPFPCVCGGAGHVEAIASGPAIRETYLRLGGTAPARTPGRSLPSPAGDAIATSCRDRRQRGRTGGGRARQHPGPEVVLVSGGLSDAGAPWWSPWNVPSAPNFCPLWPASPYVPPHWATRRPLWAAGLDLDLPITAPAEYSQPSLPNPLTMILTPEALEALRGRLIVSCQAYPGEPMRDPRTTAQMAASAVTGGAAAIRVQGLADVQYTRARWRSR